MLTLTKQGVEQQNPYCCVINYSEKKMSARHVLLGCGECTIRIHISKDFRLHTLFVFRNLTTVPLGKLMLYYQSRIVCLLFTKLYEHKVARHVQTTPHHTKKEKPCGGSRTFLIFCFLVWCGVVFLTCHYHV